MKILIVEDNKEKLNTIRGFLKKKIEKAEFTEAMSYSSGITKIYDETWDLIILDMSLPTYDISHSESGGEKKPVAGREILRRMLGRKIYVPTIIVTQFDVFGEKQISIASLNQEFEKKYRDIWVGTVSYDKPNWQSEFETVLKKL